MGSQRFNNFAIIMKFIIGMFKIQHFCYISGVRIISFKGITLVRSDGEVKITTDLGLIVSYNGVYNVFVEVSGQYTGDLLGLCGNFNGEQKDDFTTKDDEVTGDAALFGNSWKVEDSCPDVPNEPNPCEFAGPTVTTAKKLCSLLSGPPFKQCQTVLDPNVGYIPNCLYDVCGCENSPTACLCGAYDAYSEDCRAAGVFINWRNLPMFRMCSKYYKWLEY